MGLDKHHGEIDLLDGSGSTEAELTEVVSSASMKSLRVLVFASLLATVPVVAAGQSKPSAQTKPKPAPPKPTVKRPLRPAIKPALPTQLGVTTPSGLTYVITSRAKAGGRSRARRCSCTTRAR